jgi:hypothetical protein
MNLKKISWLARKMLIFRLETDFDVAPVRRASKVRPAPAI